MMNQEPDVRYIERFMAQTARANDFNEENINHLMERVGVLERGIADLTKKMDDFIAFSMKRHVSEPKPEPKKSAFCLPRPNSFFR